MRITLLALALVAVPPAFAADKIEGWSHGEAYVFTHTPEGPMRLGQVAADGRVAFDWPSVPSTEQTLGATFPSCLESGEPIVSPASPEFWPTSLFVASDDSGDQELGGLHLVSSPDVVAWKASYGQESAVEGAWFQYVHVSQAARLEARCVMPTYTGEDEDMYEQVTDYAVQFESGWNLMRNDITKLHTAPSGKTHPASIRVTVQDGEAEDARWVFETY